YRAAPRQGNRPLMVVAVVASFLMAAVVGGGAMFLYRELRGPAEGERPVTQVSPSVAGAASCTYAPANGDIKDVGTPPSSAAGLPSTATIETSRGTVQVELDPAKAPCAVNSLAFLASKNYYDDTECHRLTTNPTLKVLQCGDPSGTGTGGPGYQFADENTTGVRYTRGVVAMANAGPNTNGSQFFILYEDAPSLPPNYPVIGRVTSGMDVVDEVARAGTEGDTEDGKPEEELKIDSLRTA
ncbi:peptidylprolyl isomerase, partial [Actinomadura sp. GC306]|uniref:peptidylprolyl isomerase n=1 Tax=Actinomadura sp. GC306 TaxID=2530367 RepID=UPI0010524C23